MNLWIQTYLGKRVNPLALKPSDIEIGDIAHALSNLCRFGGHSRLFYSVAEHSYLVSQNVPAQDALWGLLHDATEAYLVDLPRPLKQVMPGYWDAEENAALAIATRFDLCPPVPESVHSADRAILIDEADICFAGHTVNDWPEYESRVRLGVKLPLFGPKVAEDVFLSRFHELAIHL